MVSWKKRFKRKWCKNCGVDAARVGIICTRCYNLGVVIKDDKFEWIQNGRPIYALYIKSPEWKRKRTKKLRIVGARCQNITCRSRFNLQVHHLTYDRLGREKMSDLKVLCRACHMDAHDKLPFPAKFYRTETQQPTI